MWKRGAGLDGPNVRQQGRVRRHGGGMATAKHGRGRGFMRWDAGRAGWGEDDTQLKARGWVDGGVVLAFLIIVVMIWTGVWHD